MIKNKDAYTAEVTLVTDPRSTQTEADRKSQHDMTMTLYGMMSRMTMVVESITDTRDQAQDRAARLPPGDALRKHLETLGKTMEDQRQALVSVKEGEVVSGEDKLREELATLYGNVNLYEGKPTASQTNRMATLGKEMEAAYAKFQASIPKDLAALNSQLKAKSLEPIVPLTEAGWKAKKTGG
jgi:hypothetical protein